MVNSWWMMLNLLRMQYWFSRIVHIGWFGWWWGRMVTFASSFYSWRFAPQTTRTFFGRRSGAEAFSSSILVWHGVIQSEPANIRRVHVWWVKASCHYSSTCHWIYYIVEWERTIPEDACSRRGRWCAGIRDSISIWLLKYVERGFQNATDSEF